MQQLKHLIKDTVKEQDNAAEDSWKQKFYVITTELPIFLLMYINFLNIKKSNTNKATQTRTWRGLQIAYISQKVSFISLLKKELQEFPKWDQGNRKWMYLLSWFWQSDNGWKKFLLLYLLAL